jgi:hypothetical protein
MKNIETSIEILASADTIWNELISFSTYHSWNPFIIKAEGEAKVGARLNLKMLNGKNEMLIKPTVQISEAGKEFQWLGKGLGGMFKGQHYFKLEERNGSTLLTHGENFSGLLSGLVLGMIKETTIASFNAMNEALKEKVESS